MSQAKVLSSRLRGTAESRVVKEVKKTLEPSQAYLDIVKKESSLLSKPRQDILLILDLNGTLVSRTKKNKSMYVRPYSKEFFDYIFDNFTIMLWSSAQNHSVKFMSKIFGDKIDKLIMTWDRDSFGLSTRDFNRKVVTIKDLNKVWQHFDNKYDATNTILLDDSPLKTALQPYNAIHPTEFEHFSSAFHSSGESELLQIMNYLKTLQLQSNIANYIKNTPFHLNHVEKEKNIHLTDFYTFNCTTPKVIDLKSTTNDTIDELVVGITKVQI